MFPSNIETIINEIEADNRTGAAELTVKAVQALQLLGKTDGNRDEMPDELVALGVRLIQAQPRMASMFALVNGALLEMAEPNAPPPSAFLERYCAKFLDDLDAGEDALARKASGVLREGDTVLTHSSSSMVRETLLAAAEAGKKPQVICTESRPVCEGVTLATELAEHGIPARLIPDAAMASFLPQADLVLVGADAVREQGFFNKIGTKMLAMAAQTLSVDLYVLCTSHKFLPPDAELPPQKDRDPAEVLQRPPKGVTPCNIYFEETPLKYCSSIITEGGILKPGKLKQKLHGLKTAPRLKRLLSDKP